ncbi:aminotransferase class V-fold PLP-dependent enzyme, partial [Candidatus Gracilibacteria bacterium]|nr:aminotransferase class V-fold PLP-dependent enzyme [Candidatus Gracilibacteria bacterium]
MFTYNVGPSEITDEVYKDILDLTKNGFLSKSHRSQDFTDVSKSVHDGLKVLLDIPDNYKIFYLSSATECMEVVLRNFAVKNTFHFVNGAFSSKFYKTSEEIGKSPKKEELNRGRGDFEYKIPDETELICLTQNETSTGVYILNEKINELRNNNMVKLIAVDIVSSIGGVYPNIVDADIWFFSVQKCFGLPAGLGIMIVNEKAIEKSKEIFEKTKDIGATHSITNMLKKYDKYQTNETPNMFGIYLLSKQLERFNMIGRDNIEKETIEKWEFLDNYFSSHNIYKPFVIDKEFRSKTVYVFEIDKEKQEILKEKLKSNGIV